MKKYNYLEAVTEDIRDYLDSKDLTEYESRDEAESALYDRLWTADSVTGNASGSYYCNTWRAEEALAHNLDLLAEAVDEFGGEMDVLRDGAEACDVTIRCYLLSRTLSDVLDEYEEAGTWDTEEDAETITDAAARIIDAVADVLTPAPVPAIA